MESSFRLDGDIDLDILRSSKTVSETPTEALKPNLASKEQSIWTQMDIEIILAYSLAGLTLAVIEGIKPGPLLTMVVRRLCLVTSGQEYGQQLRRSSPMGHSLWLATSLPL